MHWLTYVNDRFHQHLFRSCHSSLLAFFRICFGTFMMMDVIQERGMSRADTKFCDNTASYCTFPLIHGLESFRLEVMVVLYAILFWNSFFVAIGYLYRINIISYTIIYWYFFLLDTSIWNNHSYLFGLVALLLCISKAHCYMSVDNIIFESNNSSVPHWNYMLLRFQVFLVYFYAGLKKTEADWLSGYSMHKLSKEWVFDPLRPLLSNKSIDYWIVHVGGFVFDISVGFLLLVTRTRVIGLLLCVCFHGMNSFIFRIGMFPYVMMASSFIFCDPSSFHVVLSKLFCFKSDFSDKSAENIKVKSKKDCKDECRWTFSQMCTAIFCVMYVIFQLFLPYSHFITKGYNSWTQGLYGYSWDMMVHSFSNQHIKIMYRNLDNGDVGYLKPEAFLRNKQLRWTLQPAMAYQYAVCIKKHLKKSGVTNPAVYFDVWKSMNKRFKQRIYDPEVDIANYQWSPFLKPDFVLPLMAELSDWRRELRKIKSKWKKSTVKYHVVFVADFPGLHLDNFISQDIRNATIHVLKGQITIHSEHMKTNLSLGGNVEVRPGVFHRVETLSQTPSCYYYIYSNKTERSLAQQVDAYGRWLEGEDNNNAGVDDIPAEFTKEVIDQYRKTRDKKSSSNARFGRRVLTFMQGKLAMLRRSYIMFCFSLRNLIIGVPSKRTLAKEESFLNSWDQNRKRVNSDPATESFNKVEL